MESIQSRVSSEIGEEEEVSTPRVLRYWIFWRREGRNRRRKGGRGEEREGDLGLELGFWEEQMVGRWREWRRGMGRGFRFFWREEVTAKPTEDAWLKSFLRSTQDYLPMA